MFKTIATGRMYNGTVHEYQDKNQRGVTRTVFRGRLNYRNEDGSYSWIDAVCFRDNPNSESNGLVGFLEDNYVSQQDGDIAHGRAIEVFGTLRETKKRMTVEVKVKGGGIKEIPNVEHDTFEIIIDGASFVPTNQSDKDTRNELDIDPDDDLELAEDDEEMEFDGEDEEEEEIEEEPAPAPSTRRQSGKAASTARSSSARTSSKPATTGRASGARTNGGSSRAANRQSAPAATGKSGRNSASTKSSSRKAPAGKETFFRD